jgi:hypothetical protein
MAYAVNFSELKARLPIEQVIAILGIELKRNGSQLRGCCPLHKGTNPTQFVVTPAKDLWRCFGDCDAGGDQLSLAARFWDCDVKKAAEELAKKLNGAAAIPASPPRDFSKVKDELDPKHPLLEPLGLTEDACKHFECGWRGKGFGSGRLLLPVHDLSGNRLLGYTARALKRDQEPLYIWPKDLHPDGLLFNAHRIEAGPLICFSDPIKVILAYQHDMQAVATYGPPTPQTLRSLATLIERLEIENVEIL